MAKSKPSGSDINWEQEFYRQLTRKAAVEADVSEREYHSYASSKDAARIYTFGSAVGAASCHNCMDTLGQWVREDVDQPIQIVFNSPGGSVLDGLALYDYIKELQSNGATINTATLGMAASMAGVLLQAGDERVIGKNDYVLIHEAPPEEVAGDPRRAQRTEHHPDPQPLEAEGLVAGLRRSRRTRLR